MPDKARNSKQNIAEAALAEFAAYGFAGARTDRIAHRAGVNKQLIYYYYGSKQGLFETVSNQAAASLSLDEKPAQDPASATGKLRAQLEQLFHDLAERPVLVAVVIKRLQEDDGRSAGEWGRQMTTRIAATISEGQGLGFFRDDVDPDLAARQAMALLLGFFALEPVTRREGEAPSRWLDSATALLLGTLTW